LLTNEGGTTEAMLSSLFRDEGIAFLRPNKTNGGNCS